MTGAPCGRCETSASDPSGSTASEEGSAGVEGSDAADESISTSDASTSISGGSTSTSGSASGGSTSTSSSDNSSSTPGGSESTSSPMQDDCGNGIAEGLEECDGNDLQGQTCSDLDHIGGSLDCNAGCTFDTSDCGPECGGAGESCFVDTDCCPAYTCDDIFGCG